MRVHKGRPRGFHQVPGPRDGPVQCHVNAVVPGFIETEMAGEVDEETRAKALKTIPMRRCGRPEDAGEMVGFLCERGITSPVSFSPWTAATASDLAAAPPETGRDRAGRVSPDEKTGTWFSRRPRQSAV